ncbi:MAG: insulinase family protein [Simkaniaceae bacterium]|nr:insulinase family protein [Simkaniaceae bacterium]
MKRLVLASMLAFSAICAKGYEIVDDENAMEILTPDLADREVAKIRLKNGLEALIISDPKAQNSAAALCVEVGSWHDPKGYAGMAHFTEHLLFMGSEKYPDESEYTQYIRDHSGVFNAFTALDRTCYIFSVENEAFDGALDRFSRFFIDPLFVQDSISRELNAVDQEHHKNLESDQWRAWSIFKTLCNPSHPNVAFSTGTAETLKKIPRDELIKWYRKTYSSDRMHLVIYSNMRIDLLKQMVDQMFSPVALSAGAPLPEVPLFSDKQRGHIAYIEPIRDHKNLSLSWELPRSFVNDTSKSPYIVGSLLTAKTPGSLYEALKAEGLINSIGFGIDDFSREQYVFQLDLDLTSDGVQNVDRVVDLIYAQIHQLKMGHVPTYAFEEYYQLNQLKYAFQERGNAYDFVSNTAYSLGHEAIESYPMRTLLPTSYDPKMYAYFIDTLTPHDCFMILNAPASLTGIYPEQKEPWNGGEYTVRAIARSRLDDLAEMTTNVTFSLPAPNPYLPTELKPVLESTRLTPPKPEVAISDEIGMLYYVKDERFGTPHVSYIFSFKAPQINGESKNQVLLDLYSYAVNKSLSADRSQAALAGLYGNLGRGEMSLTLSIGGFEQKASDYLTTYLKAMKNLCVSKELFEIYHEALLADYENEAKSLPIFQARETLAHLVKNDANTSSQLVKAIKDVSYEEFQKFSENVLEQVYIEAFATGCITHTEVTELYETVKEHLGANPFSVEDQPVKRVLNLPETGGPYQINLQSRLQGNGIALAISQGNFTFDRRASHLIFSQAISTDFPEELRTRQQTCYMVASAGKFERGQMINYFLAHSTTHQASELLARFELFLEEFHKNLPKNISEERFESIRQSLSLQYSQPYSSLSEMAQYLNFYAYERGGDFHHRAKQVEALDKLTYADFIKETAQYVSRANNKRIAVLVEGKPTDHKSFRYQRTSQDLLKQTGTYIAESQ